MKKKKTISPQSLIAKNLINRQFKPALLRFLNKLENEEPETIIYLDLFGTGIVINSMQVRNQIIKLLKSIL
jgi:hypothetical protein